MPARTNRYRSSDHRIGGDEDSIASLGAMSIVSLGAMACLSTRVRQHRPLGKASFCSGVALFWYSPHVGHPSLDRCQRCRIHSRGSGGVDK